MRLLIADSDMDTRHLVVGNLADSAIASVGCSTLRRLMLCGVDTPQIAILDWVSSADQWSGICGKIREHASTHHVHIILPAAWPAKAPAEVSFQVAADDYLKKPIDADEISALRSGWRVLEKERATDHHHP